jgi:hypothetical protein
MRPARGRNDGRELLPPFKAVAAAAQKAHARFVSFRFKKSCQPN